MVGTDFINALQSLKAAKDIGQALHSLKVAREVQDKVAELRNHLIAAHEAAFSAQSEQLAMLSRVRELEERLLQFENWEAEKQQYELKKVKPARDTFAYAVKESMQGAEPPHSICPNCYEERVKSVLQLEYYGASHRPGQESGSRLECPRCSFGAQVAWSRCANASVRHNPHFQLTTR